MKLEDILMLDRYEYLTVAIDFVLFVVMMTVVGKMIGLVANVSSIHELTEKDNASFGVSFAGAILAVAIMMTGAVSGEATISLVYEASIVTAYGLLGITLMMLTRYLFDRLALPRIAIHEHILAGNLAAAIIDAGNMIATAVVIRSIMIWVDSESFSGLSIVLVGFLFSQLVMIAVTRYRQYVYRRRHQGQLLQEAFAAGNVAVALRYFGHRVGAGLAITAASGIAQYSAGHAYLSAFVWALVSVAIVALLSLLAIAARHLILSRVDIAAEVGRQQNTAIGLIEGTIYIILGIILAALFGAPTD